jgi:hypothetical protein
VERREVNAPVGTSDEYDPGAPGVDVPPVLVPLDLLWLAPALDEARDPPPPMLDLPLPSDKALSSKQIAHRNWSRSACPDVQVREALYLEAKCNNRQLIARSLRRVRSARM